MSSCSAALDFIANAVHTGMAGHPRSIIFLAADAFGVLPPVARLTEVQFGFDVPDHCGEVPAKLLQPRTSWKEPARYDAQARDLARRFLNNFETSQAGPAEIAAGGPTLCTQ